MTQNFIIALVDKNLNMFKECEQTLLPQRIANIVEHSTRLDEISTECQFYIDEDMYHALGFEGVPFKFTKVFIKDSDLPKYTDKKYCKFIAMSEFETHVKKYNRFDSDKPLFIMAGPTLTKTAMTTINARLLLTHVDNAYNNGYGKFPIDVAKQTFKSRRSIEPTLLNDIRKYRKELKRKRAMEHEVASNGMKIFKTVEEPKFSKELLETPEYMFYEFRK